MPSPVRASHPHPSQDPIQVPNHASATDPSAQRPWSTSACSACRRTSLTSRHRLRAMRAIATGGTYPRQAISRASSERGFKAPAPFEERVW